MDKKMTRFKIYPTIENLVKRTKKWYLIQNHLIDDSMLFGYKSI